MWRHPELSTTVPVRPDGRVSIPLVDDLVVQGRTPAEIARLVESALMEYVLDPIAVVTVAGFSGLSSQNIRVLGAAAQPISIHYRHGMTLADVVIAAGGLSKFAAGNDAIVVRREDATMRQIPVRIDDLLAGTDFASNIAMAPGDVLIVPEGYFAGTWQVTHSATVTETFTDNVDQEPSESARHALITEAGPGVSVRADTARLKGGMDGQFNARHESHESNELGFRPSLSGIFNWEVYEDLFFIDTAAAVSRQTLDSRDSDADVNQETVQTYSLSPFLVSHFGSFADAETRYALTQTMVDSEEASDTTTHEIGFELTSGRQFSRLLWSLVSFASHTSESDGDDTSEFLAVANTEYAIFRSLSLLTALGYQKINETEDADDVDAPTWHIGFRARPGSRTEVVFTYGMRDGELSPAGSLTYQLGPRTVLNASYSESFDTSQERLESELEFIGIDPDTGSIVDTRTGQPFDPNTSPFTVRDEPTRTRELSVSLDTTQGRNSYRLEASGEQQGPNEGGTDETNISVEASWIRTLNRRTTLQVAGLYEHSDFEIDSRADDEYVFLTGMTYQLFRNLIASIGYTFHRRESTSPEEEFTENRIFAGVRVDF